MNRFRVGFTPTVGSVVVLATMNLPALAEQSCGSPKFHRTWAPMQLSPTASQFHLETSYDQHHPSSPLGVISECYRSLSALQAPLEPDIARILSENLWGLYVED
jgi:hypothetical protein